MMELVPDEKAASLPCGVRRRIVTVYPYTKRYFDHFENFSFRAATEGSPQLKALGKKMMESFGEGLKHLDDLDDLNDTFASLSELHCDKLHVDPENFKLLGSMIVIMLSQHLGNEFTPALQAAFEKVVAAVDAAMAYKYY